MDLDAIRDRRRLDYLWQRPAIECVSERLHNSLRFRRGDTLPYDPIEAIELCGFSERPMNDLPTIIHPNELRSPRRLDYDWDPRAIEWLADKLHRRVEAEIGDSLPRDSALAIVLLGYVVERHGELPELIEEGGR